MIILFASSPRQDLSCHFIFMAPFKGEGSSKNSQPLSTGFGKAFQSTKKNLKVNGVRK